MRGWALVGVGLLLGCGSSSPADPPEPEPPEGCDAASIALPDGTCLRPGIPLDACGEGFVHDGADGCHPTLPEACPPGQMAIPGETSCRPVMPCGDGPWGDLPVDDDTVYVDGSYAGGDADGSAAKPWPTLLEAVAAAPAGALVALAQGTYAGSVLVEGKGLRLWGICPERVTLEGTDDEAALDLATGADGTEVGGLSITGPARGLRIVGVTDIVLDRLWIHDNGFRGVSSGATTGPTSITVRDALVEDNAVYGIFVAGVALSVERTVIRGTRSSPDDGLRGRGLNVQRLCDDADVCTPSMVELRQSVVELNQDAGVWMSGSEMEVVDSVVRHTQPRSSDSLNGVGLATSRVCTTTPEGFDCDDSATNRLAIRRSHFADNHDLGILASDVDAIVEHTMVVDTLANPVTGQAAGMQGQLHCDDVGGSLVCNPVQSAQLTVANSVIARSQGMGVVVSGSGLRLEATVVRDTFERPLDGLRGRGVMIDPLCARYGSLLVCDASRRGNAEIVGSLVEGSREFGISVAGSDGVVQDTVVRGTTSRAVDGFFGDGIIVASQVADATLALSNSHVLQSERAGVASFGAPLELTGAHIACASVPLAGERYADQEASFTDGGGNFCGCPQPEEACKVVTADLEPPGGLDP